MIKVIIERRIKQGSEGAYKEAILQAKQAAGKTEGYLGGEMLVDQSDSNHILVVSTWKDRESWIDWANSEGRDHVLTIINPMLESEEAVTIYSAVQ